MKRVLFLSYHFEPDLSAGSFKNTPLAKALAAALKDEAEVHVFSTQPNRYKSFREKVEEVEELGNLRVHRIAVPHHNNGFFDQMRSYGRFYSEVFRLTKHKHYDLVYASTSKLLTAYLGMKLSKTFKCPLYLDIRDIFVDTINDVIKLPLAKQVAVLMVRNTIEVPTFKRAVHINLVSEGFLDYFKNFKNASFSFYPNGIDDVFFNVIQNKSLPPKPVVITYAGNIGEGQGLEKIIPEAASMLGDGFVFKVIGDGGKMDLLQQQIRKRGVTNVQLIDPVRRNEVIEHYRNSHYLFLHLNNYEAFKKVLPSKIFEYGATNIPILAGVNGYAAGFLKKNVENTFVFPPCDAAALVRLIRTSEYRLVQRTEFVKKYSRKHIIDCLVKSMSHYI